MRSAIKINYGNGMLWLICVSGIISCSKDSYGVCKGQVMQYPIGVHCVYLICVFLDMSQVGLLLQHRRSRVSVAMHAYPP